MIEYFIKYPHKILNPLLQHLQLTFITLIISFVLAIFISVIISRSKMLSQIILGFFSTVYSIPSFALFAILIPVLGLGNKTAIFVLVLYNQFILIRNILTGFHSVNPSIIEAARGMGMSGFQVFWQVLLPIASPVIIAGVRIAVVSTIGIATIASTINAGGLGVLLFDGLRTRNYDKILWGVVLSSLLAIICSYLLASAEKKLLKKIK